MDGEIAWKRSKSVEKEMEGLAVKIKPFLFQSKSHDEAVDLLVQSLYETLTGFLGKPFPDNWEHAHNQNITCYRLYYHYDVLDPTFPDARSPRDLIVPSVRPEKPIAPLPATSPPRAAATTATAASTAEVPPVTTSFHSAAAAAAAITAAPLPGVSSSSELSPNGIGMAPLFGGEAAIGSSSSTTTSASPSTASAALPRGIAEERRRLMEEVRAHLDLLKEFEGAVPESEINQRKRELFAILPSLSGSLATLTAAESAAPHNSAAAAAMSPSAAAMNSPPPKKVKTEGFP
jgi:hypothetical protein